jgi:hypothetical protein
MAAVFPSCFISSGFRILKSFLVCKGFLIAERVKGILLKLRAIVLNKGLWIPFLWLRGKPPPTQYQITSPP